MIKVKFHLLHLMIKVINSLHDYISLKICMFSFNYNNLVKIIMIEKLNLNLN